MNDSIPANPAPAKRNDQVPDQLERYNRRRKLGRIVRWIVSLAVLLLVILVIGALYLQSGHALRNVYLPIASKVMGTQITARDGAISLKGSARIEGLQIEGLDGQPAFTLESLVASVDPFSLLGGGLPTIREVRVVQPQLSLHTIPDGRTNWDFLPKNDEPKPKSSPKPFPSLRIGLISVVGLTANYLDASGLSMAVGDLDLSVREMEPGKTGQIELNGEGLALERPADKLSQRGKIGFKGTVTQDTAGEQIAYDGTASCELEGSGVGGQPIPPLSFAGKVQGSASIAGRIEQVIDIAARTPQDAVGQIKGNLQWDPERNVRQAQVGIEGLRSAFLNPFLSAAAPIQLQGGAALDGKIDVKGSDNLVAFQSEINGRDLSFLVSGQAAPTPPVVLLVRNQGTLDVAGSIAKLEGLSVSVQRGAAPLIDLGLESPIELALAGGKGDSGAPVASAATVRLKITDLTMETLRPWLALGGVADAGGVTAATINGEWITTLAEMGKKINVDGQGTVSGIRHASIPSSIDLQQQVRLQLDQFNALQIETAKIDLRGDGRALASASLAGSCKLAEQAAELTLKADCPAVIGAARQLGVMAGASPAGLTDGSLVSSQKVMLDGKAGQLTVEGDAQLSGMTLALRPGQSQPLEARLTNHIQLDQRNSRVLIKPMKIELPSPGAEAGLFEITGDWPMVATAGVGKLDCSVRKIDLAPWLKLTNALGGENLPPIPFEADETLERGSDGKVKLAGEVRIGLPSPDANDRAAALNLTIKNELEQIGNRIERMLVDLTGTQAGGVDDRIRIEGSGSIEAITTLKLDANVDRLDGDRYMKSWKRLSGESKQTAGAATPPAPRDEAPKAPPVTVDARWRVKEAIYQSARLADTSGTLQLENGVLQVRIGSGKVAGGTVAGEASYDMARIDPRYAWKLSLRDALVNQLIGMVDPKNAEKLTGVMQFNSVGTGQGFGEVMARSLDSQTSFNIKNGELKGLPVLDTISELTKSESFRNIKFFDFVGNIVFEQGKGKIKDTSITGPDNKIGIDGDVGADGSYDVVVSPWLASKLVKSDSFQQYAGLVADDSGFVRLPLSIGITGKGGDYKARPRATLPIGSSEGGLKDTLRGVLGGVVERETQKQSGDPAAPAGTPGATEATPAPTPTPAGDASVEDQVKGALGGLLDRKLRD